MEGLQKTCKGVERQVIKQMHSDMAELQKLKIEIENDKNERERKKNFEFGSYRVEPSENNPNPHDIEVLPSFFPLPRSFSLHLSLALRCAACN